MRIGITFDLKSDTPLPAHVPDDFQEEFDSPATIAAIASVLHGLGHEVVELGDGRAMLARVLAEPPDFVFNFAEGQGVGRSREARVPAVLEMLGIPYTGSDPLTLAVTLDKDCAKRLVQSVNLTVPQWGLWYPNDDLDDISTWHYLPYGPMIVKPAWEGSSKGIRGKCVVETPDELAAAIETHRQAYRQPIIAEEYVQGDELTVGVLGNDPPRVLGVMRVVPLTNEERFIYSLEVKRDWRRLVTYECPAKMPPARLKAVEDAALKAYGALGCRDVARIDFRLRDGVPYFLEVNPLPGLNPESSDLVILAGRSGVSYPQLITEILHAAMRRHGVAPPATARI
jgi:D-alanine-D-alanine ligase